MNGSDYGKIINRIEAKLEGYSKTNLVISFGNYIFIEGLLAGDTDEAMDKALDKAIDRLEKNKDQALCRNRHARLLSDLERINNGTYKPRKQRRKKHKTTSQKRRMAA